MNEQLYTDLDRLIDMKEKVESKKTEIAQKQGQLKGLKKQLQDNHECKTIAQAKEKIKGMEKELAEKEQEIEEKVSDLEERHPWLM